MSDGLIIQIIDRLSGPAGGLIVCLVIMYGAYLLAAKHFIPMAIRHLDEVEARWRDIMESHDADRELAASEHAIIVKQVSYLQEDVKAIKQHLGA